MARFECGLILFGGDALGGNAFSTRTGDFCSGNGIFTSVCASCLGSLPKSSEKTSGMLPTMLGTVKGVEGVPTAMVVDVDAADDDVALDEAPIKDDDVALDEAPINAGLVGIAPVVRDLKEILGGFLSLVSSRSVSVSSSLLLFPTLFSRGFFNGVFVNLFVDFSDGGFFCTVFLVLRMPNFGLLVEVASTGLTKPG